jgi:hypothetical protein
MPEKKGKVLEERRGGGNQYGENRDTYLQNTVARRMQGGREVKLLIDAACVVLFKLQITSRLFKYNTSLLFSPHFLVNPGRRDRRKPLNFRQLSTLTTFSGACAPFNQFAAERSWLLKIT